MKLRHTMEIIKILSFLLLLTSVLYSQNAPLVISGTCPIGKPGVPYSCVMTASGGKPPYHWSVPALPVGLTSKISTDTTTFTISGTPTILFSPSAPTLVKPLVK
jgi:hypothetical protein